jgi:hypothetical protein
MSMNRSLEYDVRLEVLGEDPNRGDILLAARFQNVRVKWTLPNNYFMSLDEFLARATSQVQGMEIRFNVDSSGKITHLPPLPEDIDQQLGLIIQAVLDSLDTAFLVVPGKKLRDDNSWDEKDKRGREGKLGRYRNGITVTKFAGMFRDSTTKELLARLDVTQKGEEIVTTKAGSHRSEWNGESTAYFSAEKGYLARVHGTLRKFDPTEGNAVAQIDVRWEPLRAPVTALPAGAGAPCAPGDPQCQPAGDGSTGPTDPCDPEYSGFEECPSQAAPDTASPPAAAPAATPPT